MNNKTALSLPSDLMAAVDKVVREGLAPRRNEFVEGAIRRQLAEPRRSALDAEFPKYGRRPRLPERRALF